MFCYACTVHFSITCITHSPCHFSLYNHVKPASELRQGTDYSLFKKGIRPMWEDEANKRGGRWLLSLEKRQRNNELDRYWLDIVSHLLYTMIIYS